jgi:hypothetical protein
MSYPDDLNNAEDKTAGQLESDFIKSIRATVRITEWQKVEQSLMSYIDAESIVEGVAWQDYNPADRLKKLFEISIDLHGKEIKGLIGDSGLNPSAFKLVDPNAIKWVENYAAKDIKYINDAQRNAIKDIILRGYQDGITPQQQAKLIRAHIGLDPARSESLRKYGEDLFASGKDESEVFKLMDRRGKALLNDRAKTIAINEATEAGSNASYWSTKDAISRGIIDPMRYEAYRIVTNDERLCPVCNDISGEVRKLPDGEYPSTGQNIAKVHIKCRCVEGLREAITTKESIEKVTGHTSVICEAKKLKRKDGVIFCPTVPMVEGVYNGWGEPVLREYDQFSQDAKWLMGLPVVVNHEDLNPDTRRIGQLSNPIARPDTRDIAAMTQFFEIDLTQREAEEILSGDPINGSLHFTCNLKREAGNWTNPTTGEVVPYSAREVGPYVFFEYSKVNQGVVTPEMGAGFNMECNKCKSSKLSSAQEGAAKSGGQKMAEEPIRGLEPIKESIATLSKKLESIESQFKVVAEENKTLKATLEADKKARVFEAFQTKLKPGKLAESDKLFVEYQKDPAAWVMEHADCFIQPKESAPMQGKAVMIGQTTAITTIEEANKAHIEAMEKISRGA